MGLWAIDARSHNMRSFSPQWELNPVWQFEGELEEIYKFCKNQNVCFKNLHNVTEHL